MEVSESWFFGKWSVFGTKKFEIRPEGVVQVKEGPRKKIDGKKMDTQLIEYVESGKKPQLLIEYTEGIRPARRKAQEVANYFGISFLDASLPEPVLQEDQETLLSPNEVF